jgi:peptidoglycan/xylan/chitin deacetylase (PgdA/CDA1 family)
VNRRLCALAAALCLAPWGWAQAACEKTLYLTFDTGNMRHAELIAGILARHGAKATFFVANERTVRGDYALDDAWAPYWKARISEGHAVGSHTWRHGSFRADNGDRVTYRLMDGRSEKLDAASICAEVRQPDQRFRALTGRTLDPLWRAPGGRTTPLTLAAAKDCGYRHVGWAAAGFLGDELPSETYPNALLVERALTRLRDGDVVMAHLGIWSRKDPFAPALDELLTGLSARGFCFAAPAPADRAHPG